jgi:hypothetical protein
MLWAARLSLNLDQPAGVTPHPLGVKMFSYRRLKNDQRDAHDLADLLRMGRLPQAWIAPPAARELRELVRSGQAGGAALERCLQR